jgi:hypothetical protein
MSKEEDKKEVLRSTGSFMPKPKLSSSKEDKELLRMPPLNDSLLPLSRPSEQAQLCTLVVVVVVVVAVVVVVVAVAVAVIAVVVVVVVVVVCEGRGTEDIQYPRIQVTHTHTHTHARTTTFKHLFHHPCPKYPQREPLQPFAASQVGSWRLQRSWSAFQGHEEADPGVQNNERAACPSRGFPDPKSHWQSPVHLENNTTGGNQQQQQQQRAKGEERVSVIKEKKDTKQTKSIHRR